MAGENKTGIDPAVLADAYEQSTSYLYREGVHAQLKKTDLAPLERKAKGISYDGIASFETNVIKFCLETLLASHEAMLRTVQSSQEYKSLKFSTADRSGNDYLLNLFGLYAGCLSALNKMGYLSEASGQNTNETQYAEDVMAKFRFETGAINDDCNLVGIKSNITKVFKSDVLGLSGRKSELIERAYVFFKSLKRKLEERIEEEKGNKSPLMSYLSNLELSVDGLDICGFAAKKQQKAAFETGYSSFDKNIGNEETAQHLEEAARFVGFYDPESKSNMLLAGDHHPKPFTILLEGRPGTGKSDLLWITAARVKKIADSKGMDFKLINIDNTFKSEWYGRSANNLDDYFRQISDPNTMGVIVLDDVDAIFSSRSKSHSSDVEQNLVQIFLKWLEGYGTNYRGNYIILMSSNFSAAIDNAIRNRVQSTDEVLGPRKSSHYTQIFDNELGEYRQFLGFSWKDKSKEIGELCENITRSMERIKLNGEEKTLAELCGKYKFNEKDVKFSGRDVHIICERLKNRIRNLGGIAQQEYDRISLLGQPEQQQELRKNYRKVGFEEFKRMILERFEDSIRGRVEAHDNQIEQAAQSVSIQREGEFRSVSSDEAGYLNREGYLARMRYLAAMLGEWEAKQDMVDYHLRELKNSGVPEEQISAIREKANAAKASRHILELSRLLNLRDLDVMVVENGRRKA